MLSAEGPAVPRASTTLCILACLSVPTVAAAQNAPFAGLAPAVMAPVILNPCPAGTACGDAAMARPAAGSATTYVPSPEVNERVRQRLAAELERRNPGAAAKLEAAMRQQDFRELWAKAVASDGLHPNDVADAVASYWVLNWLIVHGQTDNTTAQVRGTRRQVAAALAGNAAFRAMNDAGRQEMAEAMVYNFVLQYAAYQAASARREPALLRKLADAAEARMLAEAKLDMRRLALTDLGLSPVAPRASAALVRSRPVTAPGAGLKAAQIVRVGVAHWFGITPTGLANDYDVYVLLRDGTVYHDPEVALSDLDLAASRAAEPNKWGQWGEVGGELTFTWPSRRPGQRTERKKSDELATCRPAEPALTLAGNYSHTGGSGPVVPGGIVTLSEADLQLRRDGSFGQASATAVGGGTGIGGGTVGGGATGPRAAGRYRLDGYAIELDRDDRPPDRRFFCRYTDDDTMVFVGATPWLIRQH